MNHNKFNDKLAELLTSIEKNDRKQVENLKYECLLTAYNLFEIVINYVFLNQHVIKFDFGSSTVKAGTKLYRIRYYEDNIDFSDNKQWTPPPSKPQNRANEEGVSALYLGSTETVCLLETHIEHGQKYVLGEYEVTDDFQISGFISFDKKNNYHNIAGIILNAFLIAPARGEKNNELFQLLDSHFDKLELEDLHIKDDLLLPYKFGVLNQKHNLYEITSAVCKELKKNNPNGIRYSSCYIPFETPSIECSDYNMVLYEEGMKHIKFISSTIKTNEHKFTSVDMAKIILDGDKKKNDQT